MNKKQTIIALIVFHIISVMIIAAIQTIKEVSVTLDYNGSTELVKIDKGSKFERPEDPTKLGYEFDNWYKDEELVTPFDFELEVITTNITIYSKWNIINYTINYILGDYNVNNPNPLNYNIESNDIILQDLQYEDAEFVNWTNNNNEVVTKINQGTTGNITLNANWDYKYYNITYHLDGSINHDNNVSKYHSKQEITLLQPTKNGYEFINWTNKDDEVITKIEQDSKGDIDLYANFEIINYTITYVTDGTVPTNPTTYTVLDEI